MLNLRKRKRESADPAVLRLSLMAFIDVVLFLLLYFVMASSLTSPEGKLNSALAAERRGPGAGTSELTTQVLRVDVVNAKARFRIGGREMVERNTLINVLSALPKAPGIIVKVADDAPVAAAATALQACKDAGFTKVSYVAGP